MRIKELRLERNLTQFEVAEAISTNQRNIGRWENGENEPSASYVKQLAAFFGVSTDYLLGLEDDFGNISIEKIAPQLTAEEQKLLNDYKALNPACQRLVQDTIKTLLASSGSAHGSNKNIS